MANEKDFLQTLGGLTWRSNRDASDTGHRLQVVADSEVGLRIAKASIGGNFANANSLVLVLGVNFSFFKADDEVEDFKEVALVYKELLVLEHLLAIMLDSASLFAPSKQFATVQ